MKEIRNISHFAEHSYPVDKIQIHPRCRHRTNGLKMRAIVSSLALPSRNTLAMSCPPKVKYADVFFISFRCWFHSFTRSPWGRNKTENNFIIFTTFRLRYDIRLDRNAYASISFRSLSALANFTITVDEYLFVFSGACIA